MAYGTPASPDDIEGYYTHIRGGRAPAPELLAELRSRYEAIGGISPLARRTEAQRARLAASLDALAPGRYQVVLGQKHAPPFVEDAVAALAADGVDSVVGLVLAPHFSRAGVGGYLERLAHAGHSLGMTVTGIESWHAEPAWIDFQARAVADALATMPARSTVVFTAHSLPERALADDPYPDQLAASAAGIAARAGLGTELGVERGGERGWSVAWQSAGRTGDRWRGPDILEVIDGLAATGGTDGVVVCPQGFTADHLEVLYDIDIQATERAAGLGLLLARTRSLNDDATVFAALAHQVIRQLR